MAGQENLITRLIEHGVEFVIVGGYAAVIHGAACVTLDLDVCAPCSADDTENLARLHAALADLHPVHRMSMDRRAFVFPPRNREETGNLYLQTDLGQLVVLGAIELGDYAFACAHSLPVRYASGEYRLLREAGAPFARYQLLLPARSTYPALRAWLADTLNAHPQVALDEIAMRRDDASDAKVDTRVRLTLYQKAD